MNYVIVVLTAVVILLTCYYIFIPSPFHYEYNTESFVANVDHAIPKVIYQTYHTKAKIPAKVFRNISTYAPDYKHVIFDDTDIRRFLREEYGEHYVSVFNKLKGGAHKADFFRYCLLYKRGGVYMDIKTKLIKPIGDIFTDDRVYLVNSLFNPGTIYNGIIATPPRVPLFKIALLHVIHLHKYNLLLSIRYHVFVSKLHSIMKKELGEVRAGPITKSGIPYYILSEERFGAHECSDGIDRYGLCMFVTDKGEKVIKTRYADYPW